MTTIQLHSKTRKSDTKNTNNRIHYYTIVTIICFIIVLFTVVTTSGSTSGPISVSNTVPVAAKTSSWSWWYYHNTSLRQWIGTGSSKMNNTNMTNINNKNTSDDDSVLYTDDGYKNENYLYHFKKAYPIIDCILEENDTSTSTSSTSSNFTSVNATMNNNNNNSQQPPKQNKNLSKINKLRPSFIYENIHVPRVVEFYAPWCPHCQHLRFHFIELAKQIQSLVNQSNIAAIHQQQQQQQTNSNTTGSSTSNLVNIETVVPIQQQQQQITLLKLPEFYTVSCTVHKALCHKYNVHGYPKIKLLPIGATNFTEDIPYWQLHPYDIITKLNITLGTTGSTHADIDSTHFENSNNNNNPTQTQTQRDMTHAEKKKNTKNNIYKYNKKNHNLNVFPIRTKQELYNDAALSFFFTIRNNIFMDSNTILTNQTQIALKNFLQLVQKTIPMQWTTIQVPVRIVLQNFNTIVLSEEQLLNVLDVHVPISKGYEINGYKWSLSCTKSIPGMGYTCGLWHLLHIMSIGVVEYNLLIDADDDSTLYYTQLSTTYVSETVRTFIQYFFNCIECRQNFLYEYDTNCIHDHCTRFDNTDYSWQQWIQYPVWLWETHNTINIRLLHESINRNNNNDHQDRTGSFTTSEQEKYNKVSSSTSLLLSGSTQKHNHTTNATTMTDTSIIRQLIVQDGATIKEVKRRIYPYRHDCIRCWTNTGEHIEGFVFQYLRSEYWPDDDHTTVDRKEIMTLDPLDEFSDDDFDFKVHHGKIVDILSQQYPNDEEERSVIWRMISLLFLYNHQQDRHLQQRLSSTDSSSSSTTIVLMTQFVFLQFVPFCTVIGLATSWYLRTVAKHRSGRHKKVDC